MTFVRWVSLLVVLFVSGCANTSIVSTHFHGNARTTTSLKVGESFSIAEDVTVIATKGIKGVKFQALGSSSWNLHYYDGEGLYRILVTYSGNGFELANCPTRFQRRGIGEVLPGVVVVLRPGDRWWIMDSQDFPRWKKGEKGWWSDPSKWEGGIQAVNVVEELKAKQAE